MFVAMPSALAIINHYYTAPYQPTPSSDAGAHEEKAPNSRDTADTPRDTGRKHVLNAGGTPTPTHVADTSSADDHRSSYEESDRQLFGGFK
jgi:hypothetical protein